MQRSDIGCASTVGLAKSQPVSCLDVGSAVPRSPRKATSPTLIWSRTMSTTRGRPNGHALLLHRRPVGKEPANNEACCWHVHCKFALTRYQKKAQGCWDSQCVPDCANASELAPAPPSPKKKSSLTSQKYARSSNQRTCRGRRGRLEGPFTKPAERDAPRSVRGLLFKKLGKSMSRLSAIFSAFKYPYVSRWPLATSLRVQTSTVRATLVRRAQNLNCDADRGCLGRSHHQVRSRARTTELQLPPNTSNARELRRDDDTSERTPGTEQTSWSCKWKPLLRRTWQSPRKDHAPTRVRSMQEQSRRLLTETNMWREAKSNLRAIGSRSGCQLRNNHVSVTAPLPLSPVQHGAPPGR